MRRITIVLNQDFGHGGAGGIDGRAEMMNIDGVMVVKSRHIPTSNDTSNAAVFSKYRANFSNTALIMWCPQAVATVKMMDISMETERDVRRLEDFLVSKMFVGHDVYSVRKWLTSRNLHNANRQTETEGYLIVPLGTLIFL